MHPDITRFFLVLLLAICPATLRAANLSVKIVDGLGRPVAGVVVDIHWLKTTGTVSLLTGNGSGFSAEKVGFIKLVSDKKGVASGTYDEISISTANDISVEISKNGYNGYTMGELQPAFILRRKFAAADVQRVGALVGEEQASELREILAGDFDNSGQGVNEQVFVLEHKFRPALRALISDPKIGAAAGELLAFIGVPDDVRLFIDHAPSPKREPFKDRWAYGVVSALLEPATENEWTFLRDCAMNDYDDLWVDAGAIRTLKLIASPMSKQILKEVGESNKSRADWVEDAIEYIESTPASLSDEDLDIAGKRVAQAITSGKWQGNKAPRFNEKRDKALVQCEFVWGMDQLVHTATFHKVDGSWRLRGVRETLQGLLERAPETDPE